MKVLIFCSLLIKNRFFSLWLKSWLYFHLVVVKQLLSVSEGTLTKVYGNWQHRFNTIAMTVLFKSVFYYFIYVTNRIINNYKNTFLSVQCSTTDPATRPSNHRQGRSHSSSAISQCFPFSHYLKTANAVIIIIMWLSSSGRQPVVPSLAKRRPIRDPERVVNRLLPQTVQN